MRKYTILNFVFINFITVVHSDRAHESDNFIYVYLNILTMQLMVKLFNNSGVELAT